MTGRVYLERGRPVTVVTPYCARRVPELASDWLHFQWPGPELQEAQAAIKRVRALAEGEYYGITGRAFLAALDGPTETDQSIT